MLLRAARGNMDPELRRTSVQAMGRIGGVESLGPPSHILINAIRTSEVAPIERLLNDDSVGVRREAANAIAEYLSGVPRELQRSQRHSAEHIATGRSMLERRLTVETDDEVAGTILEAIGRLRYTDDTTRSQVEAFLVGRTTGKVARVLGATKGLEALIRANPARQIATQTRETLRRLAVSDPLLSMVAGSNAVLASGDVDKLARSRRLALSTLEQVQDDHVQTLVRAAFDADWQVRRLAARRFDFSRSKMNLISMSLLNDEAFQVRYEMVGRLAAAAGTKYCSRLLRAFDDPETTVVLRAIDVMPEACAEKDEVVERLTVWAERLKTPLDSRDWHVPAHAFEALARLRPKVARTLLNNGVDHEVWQVRARTAAAAVHLNSEEVARHLADDREPNVRKVALESLVTLKSPAVFQAAIRAVEGRNNQLIRTAAMALRGTPEPERLAAVNALLRTLGRLTEEAADTSREPRLAILERLGELLPAHQASDIAGLLEDFDDRVRQAAASALTRLTGIETRPAYGGTRRYPYQPTSDQLTSLPTGAVIRVDSGGEIQLELLTKEAPVTIARFAELVRAGYYDGLTFHHIVPNFVTQGGSPDGNDYSGVARYMRDEIGTEPHTRGAVGISARGRDTGNGQFFIDLVDIPYFDHHHTVFARVISGLDVAERMLEGTRILYVRLK
jgi:cyclophilin family peptidyl-prolyl cis-trans isomerase